MKNLDGVKRVGRVACVLLALGAASCADEAGKDGLAGEEATSDVASAVSAGQMTKIVPASDLAGRYGSSVALLANGNIVVGAPANDANGADCGLSGVIDASGSGTYLNGLMAGQERGFAVAAEGSLRAIGSPGTRAVLVQAPSFGAVTLSSSLLRFGAAVDVDEATGRVIVGAPENAGGAARVYSVAADGVVSGPESLPFGSLTSVLFGYAVAIDGTTAAVGSPNETGDGKVRIYERIAGVWTLEFTYTAPSLNALGNSLSLDGDTLAVGAWRTDLPGASEAGSVVILRKGQAGWAVEQTLSAADPDATDRFGRSVALEGDRLLVGANLDDEAATDAGAVYIFERGATWVQEDKVLSGSPQVGEYFGTSVALAGSKAVVGAWGNDEVETDAGAIYLFDFMGDDGEACSAGGDCGSGFCVDGVCCNQACGDGSCQACALAMGASVDGVCTPLTGASCDDGDLCTTADVCQAAGSCGGSPVVCATPDECHAGGSCDPANGQCSQAPELADGTACTDGTCLDGICESSGEGGAGGAEGGAGGSAGEGGSGGSMGDGGSPGEGGSPSQGGSSSDGGSPAQGGSAAQGGSSSDDGGPSDDDGSTSDDGSSDDGADGDTDEGGGCTVGAVQPMPGATLPALIGLAWLLCRARRRAA